MAIHVRPVNRTRRILLQNLRKTLLLAYLIAFATLLFNGLALYFNYILIEGEKEATFTYVRIEEDTPPTPPTPQLNKDLAGGAPLASSSLSPQVIVSTAVDSIAPLPPMDTDIGESIGIGTEGLNLGLGDGGIGEGFGGGTARGGSGASKGKRAGYNDDIQVVLALDASGSMDRLFAAVANAMEGVLTTLSNAKLNGKKTKVNVGIVVYGQSDNNGAPFILTKFTTKLNELRDKVKETPCDGYNEECGHAIRFAADRFPWNMRERDDMLKVIFICGNEPFDQGPINYKQAIAHARSKNIIINTVHCDSTDSQWQEAAALGEGMGLSFIPSESDDKAIDYNALHDTLQALLKLPILPTGSPAVQQALLRQHNKIPPPPKGEKQLTTWLGKNRQALINGYDADAAEICRRLGADNFSLATIGGRGNLPLSLRGMSDEDALQAIRQAAAQRADLLLKYKSISGNSDFASTILETLRVQALERGINIEL